MRYTKNSLSKLRGTEVPRRSTVFQKKTVERKNCVLPNYKLNNNHSYYGLNLKRLSVDSICKEWLVTNALGGYASSTLQNINTRKFHGLLIAALSPPTNRWVFLSALNDYLKIGTESYRLSDHIVEYVLGYLPTFVYDIHGICVKKRLFMPYMRNTTMIEYDVDVGTHTDTDKILMVLSPELNSRHFYNTTPRGGIVFYQNRISDNKISVRTSNADTDILLFCENACFEKNERWLEAHYQSDRERGEAWQDNNFQIGDFKIKLFKNKKFYFACSVEPSENFDVRAELNKEIARRRALIEHAALPKEAHALLMAADSFVVQRDAGNSIIAGYHWFSDWGRDCFIALPGATLVTKRFEEAKKIILTFSSYCRCGLIPNTFLDAGSMIYNTADASLWYIDSVFQYFKYTNDLHLIRELWTVLKSIIYYYITGTGGNIKMDDDYLIKHSAGLTWMDVKIGNDFITPRGGKAIEIQALWYNALSIMSVFSDIIRDKDNNYSELKDKVKDNFTAKFTDFYDVIEPADRTLRPNLIFLASLDFSMLGSAVQDKIISNITANLLTHVGLRSLDENDSRYLGTYLGWHNKDLAYHNGCVWSWLIGPFVRAFLKTKKYAREWRAYAYKNFLSALLIPETQQCPGTISEIFDGDAPHRAQGCISQAWSVAEVLRTWVEDIMLIRPKYEYSLVEYGLDWVPRPAHRNRVFSSLLV